MGDREEVKVEVRLAHHTAALEDVTLHYVIAGSGDPVVLLHGWPQTWYEWRYIIPALADRYTVIAPDMRGIGDSSRPVAGYDKRTIANDIYQLVRKLGFEKIFLVGHDWGGPVAYAYACAHPDDVRRLAILDVTIPGEGWENIRQINRRGGIWHLAFHSVRDLPEALVAGRERLYLSWFYRSAAYDPSAISEADIDEYARCYSAPGAMRAGFEYYRAIFADVDHNKENAKTKLKMPVLALGGERGFHVLPLRSMKELAEDVRGGVVERSGHWIAEERPEYLIDQLTTFFAEK
ncbi:MAG TPA: alpha/beta hydrolase [Candidatus Binataceae bacterium]|nr:alpha/beta hydrolase [Candidatus Binataceae bacterium]